MLKAVLKNGLIYPLEPVPVEWSDGRELRVEDAQAEDTQKDTPQAMDEWYQELEGLVAQIDPQDIQCLESALAAADKQAKELVRREMGLA